MPWSSVFLTKWLPCLPAFPAVTPGSPVWLFPARAIALPWRLSNLSLLPSRKRLLRPNNKFDSGARAPRLRRVPPHEELMAGSSSHDGEPAFFMPEAVAMTGWSGNRARYAQKAALKCRAPRCVRLAWHGRFSPRLYSRYFPKWCAARYCRHGRLSGLHAPEKSVTVAAACMRLPWRGCQLHRLHGFHGPGCIRLSGGGGLRCWSSSRHPARVACWCSPAKVPETGHRRLASGAVLAQNAARSGTAWRNRQNGVQQEGRCAPAFQVRDAGEAARVWGAGNWRCHAVDWTCTVSVPGMTFRQQARGCVHTARMRVY